MSDKQMVLAPRELLERLDLGKNTAVAIAALPELRELLAKPAEQHPGEQDSYPPCDYCGATPDHHPWHGSGLLNGAENRHIHACDGCRGKLPLHPDQNQVGPVAVVDEGDDGLFVELIYGDNGNPLRRGDKLHTRPAQGEVVGWQFYQQSKWWNGDDRIKDHRKNSEAAGIPTRDVYTHVDPAEVERLRCEVSKWRGKAGRLTHERDTLRAQLAGRDALLRKVPDMPKSVDRRLFDDADPDGYLEGDGDWCDNNPEVVAWLIENHAAIRAALSASAEPSAPTWACQSCQLEQPTDRPCDVCGGKTELIATKS